MMKNYSDYNRDLMNDRFNHRNISSNERSSINQTRKNEVKYLHKNTFIN